MRNGFIALVLAFGLSTAAMAAELQPKTVAYLIELGFDPKSPTVTDIAGDVVKDQSLDTLAADRDRQGTRRFIATRNFVRKYRKNTATPFPPRELYNTSFLTSEEVKFVSAEIVRQRCAAEKASGAKPNPYMPCPK